MKSFNDSYGIELDVETAIGLMTTEQYIKEKYTAMGANQLRVTVLEDSDEKFHSRVERVVRMRDKAPSFAKRLLKEEMTVVHEVWWGKTGDVKQGGFKGELPGMSGGIEADLSMADDGDGKAVISIEGRVKVGIPLIGGKLESYMAGIASDKFREDIEATRNYLKAHA